MTFSQMTLGRTTFSTDEIQQSDTMPNDTQENDTSQYDIFCLNFSINFGETKQHFCAIYFMVVPCQWEAINRKQITRWQHVSWLKGWSGFSPKRHFPEAAFHRTGISPNALIRVGSPNDLRRAFGELKAAFHLLLLFTELTINSLN